MAEYSSTKLTPSSTTKFPANNGNTPGYVEGADLTTKQEFTDAINAISDAIGSIKTTSTTLTVVSGQDNSKTVNTNAPAGTYLVLVQSEITTSYNGAFNLDIKGNSTSTLNAGGYTVFGNALNGGGLVNFAVMTFASDTNSIVCNSYGYHSSNVTQRYRVTLIRIK